jgi:hypothetical protein
MHFYLATQKILVTKVVVIGKMHISAKNGANIRKFDVELAQTKLNWVESQVKSWLVSFFVKSFSLRTYTELAEERRHEVAGPAVVRRRAIPTEGRSAAAIVDQELDRRQRRRGETKSPV